MTYDPQAPKPQLSKQDATKGLGCIILLVVVFGVLAVLAVVLSGAYDGVAL